jgi:hypothetical protein
MRAGDEDRRVLCLSMTHDIAAPRPCQRTLGTHARIHARIQHLIAKRARAHSCVARCVVAHEAPEQRQVAGVARRERGCSHPASLLVAGVGAHGAEHALARRAARATQRDRSRHPGKRGGAAQAPCDHLAVKRERSNHKCCVGKRLHQHARTHTRARCSKPGVRPMRAPQARIMRTSLPSSRLPSVCS